MIAICALLLLSAWIGGGCCCLLRRGNGSYSPRAEARVGAMDGVISFFLCELDLSFCFWGGRGDDGGVPLGHHGGWGGYAPCADADAQSS